MITRFHFPKLDVRGSNPLARSVKAFHGNDFRLVDSVAIQEFEVVTICVTIWSACKRLS